MEMKLTTINRLRSLTDEAKTFRAGARQLERSATERENAAKLLLAEQLGVDHWDIEFNAFWGCPPSPIKMCAYNMRTFIRDDECIFCGDPAERK